MGYQPGQPTPTGINNYVQELAQRFTRPDSGLEVAGAEVRQFFRIQPYADGEIVHIPLIMGSQALLSGRYRRSVVTVHDLGGLLCPLDRASNSLLHSFIFRLALQGLKRATHLIAVSEYTKTTLVENLGIDPQRITVIYQGVDHEQFYPRSQAIARQTLTERLSLTWLADQPVLLYVGSELPRKNLGRLWAALAGLRRVYPGAKVLKVGAAGGGLDQREITRQEIARQGLPPEAVQFLDKVSQDDLPLLYSAADMLIQPSLYEGFSLPVAEAMAAGCPVVAARATCLPEIVDGAGFLFDPASTGELVTAIQTVYSDQNRREKLIAAGIIRAANFQWDITAERTREIYNRLGQAEEVRAEEVR